MQVHVTKHAVERYQERVRNVTAAEARQALSGPVIAKAVEFGAPYVKLGTGQHVVLEGATVVTVLPRDEYLGCMAMDRRRTAHTPEET